MSENKSENRSPENATIDALSCTAYYL